MDTPVPVCLIVIMVVVISASLVSFSQSYVAVAQSGFDRDIDHDHMDTIEVVGVDNYGDHDLSANEMKVKLGRRTGIPTRPSSPMPNKAVHMITPMPNIPPVLLRPPSPPPSLP